MAACTADTSSWIETVSAQSFVVQDGRMTDLRTHSGLTSNDMYSFGEDGAGEVYMLTGWQWHNNSGRVARIVE